MKKVLYSIFDHDPELDHECTSWMVFNDLTGSNSNILHKNRDSKVKDVGVVLSPEDSARKWIALGSNGNPNMGINISGLAGVMNSGEPYIGFPTDKSKKTTPELLKVILESCDTAAQAVDKLRELISAGDYWHKNCGSIFFFMDRNEGYICEFTLHDFTVVPYHNGYAVRANIWQNPQMQRFSRNSVQKYLNSSTRAFMAYSGLNGMLDNEGKITLPGIFELSRRCDTPEGAPQKRAVCFVRTNSTASLEIDRQYPDVLSSGYFTVGHPRNTIYIPVPVCAEKLLPGMDDYRWSDAAWKRFDEFGYNAPIPDAWQEFERSSMEKYCSTREEARRLLEQGKRCEAVTLLNSCAEEIWRDTAALLEI